MMKKDLLLLVPAILFSNIVTAQSFAINTDGSTANASALLDVKSTTKGLLIPRMSKTERYAIASPATGLLVFQNAPDSLGFYYFNGSTWNWVVTSANTDSMAWKRNGNFGTNPSTHFIGTSDNKVLNFKVNNTKSGIIDNVNYNTALGFSSEFNNTGTHNTAMGYTALANNTSGNYNTSVGAFSSFTNTTGIRNTAVGTSALYFNNANDNTAVGYEALNQTQSTIAKNNTAIGSNALRQNISGTANTAVGDSAGYILTSANYNVFFGKNAGRDNLGSWTTLIGIDAGPKNTANGSVFIGSAAGMKNTSGFANTFVGDNAGRDVTTTSGNTFFGSYTGQYTSGSENSFLGRYAGTNNTSGNYNSFIGSQAGLASTTASDNTFTGYNAGRNNFTGTSNSFYGSNAGYFIKNSNYNALFGTYAMGLNADTCSYNSAFGTFAAMFFRKGDKNVFLGYNTANNLSVGNENTIVGYQAGVGDTADLNVSIGSFAGGRGDENVFIGHDAGKNNSLASMDGSTYIGSWAGFFKRANYSLLLGYSSSVLADGYTNASAIGAYSRVDTSNAMVLGSTAINVGIGITKPYQAKFTVSANTSANGATMGLFGPGQKGISIQQNNPTIGWNQFRDISAAYATRYMGTGYAWVNHMDPTTGVFYWNSMPSGTGGTAGGAETVRMALTNTGSLGLNVLPNGNGQLQFQNTLDNRKIVMWETANNTIDFYGFGINSGTLRYQVPAGVGAVHRWYAGNTLLLTLFDNGNATLTGTLTQLSDARLKRNIMPVKNALQDIGKISAYNYYWKDKDRDADQQIGLLAQEVEKVFPQLVKKDQAGLLSVNYNGFVPLLIKGMQEQQKQIEDLKKQVDELILLIKK